jgi:PEP-CTERM motif
MSRISLVAVAALVPLAQSPVHAASYQFDVDYAGSNIATLAPGSDDLLATTLQPGDDFVYTLSAMGNGYWSTVASADQFPFIALIVSPGYRVSDVTVTLLNNGASVFSYSETGAFNIESHLGGNAVFLPAELVFDQIRLFDRIGTASTASVPWSLLPWPGVGPENSGFYGQAIRYTVATVPEPETYAMLLAGVGVVGFAGRRRQRQ